jgi:uncharacterized protein (DUF433 family)
MQLEDYFDFLDPYDIRIKGHRIGIETILLDYLNRAMTAEEIAQKWTTLTLEQVYATILYYLHNKEGVDEYLNELIEHGRQMRAEQERNPTPGMLRLRRIKAEREAARRAARNELTSNSEGSRL